MSAVLYCKEGTPFTNLVLIAAEFADFALQPNFTSDHGAPIRLEVTSDVTLCQPAAVAAYVASAKPQLTGASGSDVDQARILQWVFTAVGDVHNDMCSWVLPGTGVKALAKDVVERAKAEVAARLKAINEHLLTRTFLVGERITLADVALAVVLLPLYQHVMSPAFRAPLVNLNRWFDTLVHQPQFVKVVGADLPLCAQEPQPKIVEAKAGGGGDGEGKKKEKKEKKKQDTPKKAEQPKKKEKKEAEPEDDDDQDFAPAPKKEADPFAAISKGNFDMDDFKRFYSNNDEEKSVPYFWEKLDKEHYSIWYGEYKYPTELTMVFMSCNLIGGMFQRLDKLRKNAFSSMCLFGQNNDSTISGVWVFRGQDLAFELSADWQIDYSSYDWKKLDPNAEETVKLVEQYFKWEGTDKDGRKFNQGKIFK